MRASLSTTEPFFKIYICINLLLGIPVQNSLNPDQARCLVRSDLGSKYLQMLPTDNTIQAKRYL